MTALLRFLAVVVLVLAGAGCFGNDPPVILSFKVDDPNPEAGVPVHFTFSVTGAAADGIRIDPVPGPVVTSPVTVVPPASAVYTLSVYNVDGIYVSQDIRITVRPVFAITAVDAAPGQVKPGSDVTLSWTTTAAGRATITDPTSGQVVDVATSGSMIVHPAATTVYTLTAYNKIDKPPATLTRKITARVGRPPSVSNFAVDNPSIVQGESATLSWQGNALNYSVSDGTSTFNVGPRRSLVVRPATNTTYTLQAVGPGGTSTAGPVTVAVQAHAATSLTYTAPPSGALQLIADCSPCAPVTLRIKATATVQLRGVAFNLPLDSTKVTFDRFAAGPALTGAVSKATMGRGPLHDVLVIGIAMEGTGSAPAQDVTLNPGDELANFTLGLVPAGGSGTVFNGAAPPPAYKSSLQSSSARVSNAIAVGKLDAN
jgi:hypothetical protein